MAMQSIAHDRDIPIVNTMYLVFSTLGPTIFISVAQAVFLNTFLPQMQSINPSLTATQIIHAGATELEALVKENERPSVLMAYAKSLDTVFILAAILAVVSTFMVVGVEWRSIKKGKSKLQE